jgi:NTP pyrophosphatase (non-canonical NTP hydrolase)
MKRKGPPAKGFYDFFQKMVGKWHVETFPDLTVASHLMHMSKELHELTMACVVDQKQEAVMEEAADILLMILALAHRYDFSLVTEARKKFKINLERTWQAKDEHGVVEHVREDLKLVDGLFKQTLEEMNRGK